MDAFETAAAAFEKTQTSESSSSSESNQSESNSSSGQVSQDRAPMTSQSAEPTKQEVNQAMLELDKMDKFKLDGQEMTLKDLKAAIMRQKDYTQKTQALSTERSSFQKDKEYYEKLAWDLQTLRENPSLVGEFIKIYPQQFHKYAEQFLKQGQANQSQQQGQSQQGQSQSQPDVQLMSRLDRLEKFHEAQEVQKNEQVIEATITKFSEKYPDAANFKEMVLGRAFEAHNKGVELTEGAWEDIFKQVNSEVGSLLKTKYGQMVQKQTEANSKAKDVGPGGGTAGRAPVKFKKFDDITKLALEEASRG